MTSRYINFGSIVEPFLNCDNSDKSGILPKMSVISEYGTFSLNVPRQTGKTSYLISLCNKYPTIHTVYVAFNHYAAKEIGNKIDNLNSREFFIATPDIKMRRHPKMPQLIDMLIFDEIKDADQQRIREELIDLLHVNTKIIALHTMT